MQVHFDKSLLRTVLFSFAVVAFVIGTYQTIEQNTKTALMDNYWLFMVSFGCVLLFRFLGRESANAPADPPAKPTGKAPRKTPATKPRARK